MYGVVGHYLPFKYYCFPHMQPINLEHEEFRTADGKGTRANKGTVTFPGSLNCATHGTHVAGVVGGRQWGVAKNVTLWEGRKVASPAASMGSLS